MIKKKEIFYGIQIPKTFYAKGGATGSGSSADDPLGFELEKKWDLIEDTAKSEPVVVRLVAGLHLHPQEPQDCFKITHRNFAKRATIVSDEPGAAYLHRMVVERSSNLEINGLIWVNPPHRKYRTALPIGDSSHDVDVVNCVFRNLPNIYRSGSHAEASSHHIRYMGCTFEKIGDEGGSHLMYHVNNAHHITLSKCTFKDCLGSYVKFRNNVHHCVVHDCLFENTNHYENKGFPNGKKNTFISQNVTNDKRPGTVDDDGEYPGYVVPDDERHPEYEMFGTDFIVSNSSFIGKGAPFRFGHFGWHFPGHDYRLRSTETGTPEGTLEGESISEWRTLLKDKYGIRVERVMMLNINAETEALCWFSTTLKYGAAGDGFVDADVDITPLINSGAYRGKVNAITLDEVGCYVELEPTGNIQWVIEKATHPNYDAIVRVLHDTAVQREKVLLRLRRDIGRTNEILYINRKYII